MDVQNWRGGISLVSSGWDSVFFLQMAQVPPLIGELGSHKLQGAPNHPKQKRGVASLSLRKANRPMCRGQREREGDCMVMRY